MFAVLKNPLRPALLVSAAVLLLALLIGLATPILVELMNGKIVKVMVLPALLLLGFLLIYDRVLMMLLIVLFRSSADLVLTDTRFALGAVQLGVGGLINLFVILIAACLVFEKPDRVPKWAYTMWTAFLLLAALGVAMSPVKGEAVRAWLTQFSNFAMFISAFYFIRSKDDFVRCVKLVLWSSLLPVLYGFVDVAIRHGQSDGADGFRLKSTFGHPNIFAFYLTLVLSLTFYMFRKLHVRKVPGQPSQNTGYRLMLLGYMLVLFSMLILTKTRSAWLACVLGFLVYALIFDRRYLLILLGGALVASMLPEVRDRLADLGHGNQVGTYAQLNSFAWRQYLWRSALEWMAPSHYLFGYGMQAFKEYAPIFFPLAGGVKWGAHSVFVQWLFDIGLVGTAAYLFLHYKVLQQLRHLLKIDVLAGFFLIVIVMSFLVCALSDNMLDYLSFNWYLWFIVGAGCAVVSRSGERPAAGPVAAGRSGI